MAARAGGGDDGGEVAWLVVALSLASACLPCSLSWHTTAPGAVMSWGDEGWRVPVGRLGRTVG